LGWSARRHFAKARWREAESPSRFSLLFAHDLFGKPLHTFPDHALTAWQASHGQRHLLRIPLHPLHGTGPGCAAAPNPAADGKALIEEMAISV